VGAHVSDDITTERDAARARLPELEAVTTELQHLMTTLLSPAVVAALGSVAGSTAAIVDSDAARSASERSTRLLREIDSLLPAMQVEKKTERG
jgi:hypothetical protein